MRAVDARTRTTTLTDFISLHSHCALSLWSVMPPGLSAPLIFSLHCATTWSGAVCNRKTSRKKQPLGVSISRGSAHAKCCIFGKNTKLTLEQLRSKYSATPVTKPRANSCIRWDVAVLLLGLSMALCGHATTQTAPSRFCAPRCRQRERSSIIGCNCGQQSSVEDKPKPSDCTSPVVTGDLSAQSLAAAVENTCLSPRNSNPRCLPSSRRKSCSTVTVSTSFARWSGIA